MLRLIKKYALLTLLTACVLSSCVDKEARENSFTGDSIPNIPELPVGEVWTVEDLLLRLHEVASDTFNIDASVYGVVIADETSDNLYKQVFIQDGDDAIELYLTATSGLRIGDSVRVYLKDAILSKYKNLPQVQNLNPNNIVILKNNCPVEAVTISIDNASNYLCRYVNIEDAEFLASDTLLNYAEEDDYGNRTLYADCDKSETLTVRTSSYATFAGDKIPSGNGSIKGIVTVYNTEYQLVIMTTKDVDLNGPRCE